MKQKKAKIFVMAWSITILDLSPDKLNRITDQLGKLGIIVDPSIGKTMHRLIVIAPTNIFGAGKLHNALMQVYDFDSFSVYELGLIGPYKPA